MIRRPPRSTRVRSSAASDVYKRQTATSTRDVCVYESYYSKKPIVYDNLQPFGQIGYVTKWAKLRKKFADKSTKCICLGNAKDHAADVYRVYNMVTKSTQFSRDIKWADWHGSQSPTENGQKVQSRTWKSQMTTTCQTSSPTARMTIRKITRCWGWYCSSGKSYLSLIHISEPTRPY